jgi:hypothetical protein
MRATNQIINLFFNNYNLKIYIIINFRIRGLVEIYINYPEYSHSNNNNKNTYMEGRKMTT